MVGYFIIDALTITCLVCLSLILIHSAVLLGIKIYRHIRYKKDKENYRLSMIERQIASLQHNDEVHMTIVNKHKELLDLLDEKLKNKEDKKNVKKKKRN